MGETKGVGNTKKRTTPEQAPTAVFLRELLWLSFAENHSYTNKIAGI